MPRATVRFLILGGRSVALCPGDMIGRLESAALPIDDPRVSEAHAMVSLRGGRLCLLALRGRLVVRRAAASVVRLEPGVRISLVEGIELVVEAVELPDTALALEGLGPAPLRLVPPVCALTLRPRPAVVPRFVHGAAARSSGPRPIAGRRGWATRRAGTWRREIAWRWAGWRSGRCRSSWSCWRTTSWWTRPGSGSSAYSEGARCRSLASIRS